MNFAESIKYIKCTEQKSSSSNRRVFVFFLLIADYETADSLVIIGNLSDLDC